MAIVAVGINHKTSSIDIREKFYLQSTQKELLLSELKNDPRVVEAFLLSTCNRTEIYANILGEDPQVLLETLFRIKNLPLIKSYTDHFYQTINEEAVKHVLSVTSGLDSLILGEKQIHGQMKEALALSAERKMLGKNFNILANIILETGKKVRRETDIDFGGSSVSWAAVAAAQQSLGSLKDKKVMILGSGKMGRLAIEQLAQKEVSDIFLVNRTLEKAEELAKEYQIKAVPFWDLKEKLIEVDVCICSASCTHYLIDHELVARVVRERGNERPVVFIDISVPRNIDPSIIGLPSVTLIAVDDLDQVVQSNLQRRLAAVKEVEDIIATKTSEYFTTIAKRQQYKLAIEQCNLINI